MAKKKIKKKEEGKTKFPFHVYVLPTSSSCTTHVVTNAQLLFTSSALVVSISKIVFVCVTIVTIWAWGKSNHNFKVTNAIHMA